VTAIAVMAACKSLITIKGRDRSAVAPVRRAKRAILIPPMNFARFAALSLLALSAFAQTPQPQDEEFAKLVKQWTTRPEFSSPLVDHLPKAAGVPTPKDVLGYYIGEPKRLTRVADINKYYRALAAASKRVKVLSAGTTDEGRECLVTVISDESNIANLDTYRRNLARLADPRGLTDAEAHRVIAASKPVYMFTGGLHSSETGPPEMLMELAYRLAVEDSPLYDSIRKNVIVMINNSSDPDGRDRYVDWYYKYLTSVEKEDDRIPGPPYWGKYIYHDNNRDINYSQVTMRNWLKFYLDWHPPIMHDLHESQPLMYTFSGQSPQNPTLDPILYGELPWFSNFEMTKMISYGMPGVWTHAFVDMWSPGYLGFMASNHNGMLRMYETFGNGGANTMKRTLVPTDAAGGRGGRGGMTAREWYRPLPPPRELQWSMRNNTNYMETGVLSALELTAGFSQTVLENFYMKSRNSVKAVETEAPYGYVLPGNQPDMTRVAFVVNTLRLQGIEVGRATAEIKLKDATYPAGSLVIKRNQPYGRLAKILLEKQNFPTDAQTTYDDTGWTMGLMSQADVKEIADKAILDVKTQPIEKLEITGAVKGDGPIVAVLHNGANSLITLRYRLKDVRFEAIEKSVKAGDTELPAGTMLVENSARLRSEVAKLGLQAVALAKAPDVKKHSLELPRVAMFSTWGNTQEVGWVRYAFDQFEIPYDLIYKERIKKGNLRADYDVLLIPNQGRGSGKGLVFDIDAPKTGQKLAYKKSAEFASLGQYGESDDITGGMGLAGANEIDKFVNEGGVLMTLGTASYFPAEMGITRTVDASRTSGQFYAPGPIVEAQVLRTEHPVFYGYTKTTLPVRWANGPLLRLPQDERSNILMQFAGTESSVLSGLMRGAAETRNRPAIVDMEVGGGHVLLFATNPVYRWQNMGEFNMLANAILNFNDLPKAPAPPKETEAATKK
jgi:hypothetical protein